MFSYESGENGILEDMPLLVPVDLEGCGETDFRVGVLWLLLRAWLIPGFATCDFVSGVVSLLFRGCEPKEARSPEIKGPGFVRSP